VQAAKALADSVAKKASLAEVKLDGLSSETVAIKKAMLVRRGDL
jgi:hypothetical protein